MAPKRKRAAGKRRPAAKKPARKRTTKKRPSLRGRLFRVGLLLLVLAVAGPPLQVASLRVIHPPITGTRIQRAVEEMASGRLPRQQHRWVPLSGISTDLTQAVLLSEDQRFWIHRGFDLQEVESALEDHRQGSQLRGASTLTMQCARTVFLWQGRSWTRKGIEAMYTLWMELLLPKERILEIYLNEVEWGPNVYGADAAAGHHYGNNAWSIHGDDACDLAAILPDPRHRDPTRPGEAASAKAGWICRQMDYSLPQPP